MTDPLQGLLKAEFPGEEERYFSPMAIGSTSASKDEGASLILDGIKTATSSGFWDYTDGRIPFVGALSVLIDGGGHARCIVQTQRVAIRRFGDIDKDFARDYGEGDRSLAWFRAVIGSWYWEEAARRRREFSDDTRIICEWFTIARRC